MIFLSLLGGIHVSFHIFMFCSVPTLQIHPLSKFWTPANVLYHVFEVEAFKMSSSEKYFAPRTRVHKYSGFWISRQQCFANIAKLELRRHLKPISHILFKIDIFHHAIQYFFSSNHHLPQFHQNAEISLVIAFQIPKGRLNTDIA